jgi:hypothetical protein
VNCDVPWQKQYCGNRANVIWKWRGDVAGIPRADLALGTRLDAGNRQKYKRVQTLLELVAGAEYEETYSKHETNKTIRSHGQLEVVDEMDITTIRMKVCITCWKTQCICQNSSNDATASECSATASGKSERELPRVEVPQNIQPQHYVKADGSPFLMMRRGNLPSCLWALTMAKRPTPI